MHEYVEKMGPHFSLKDGEYVSIIERRYCLKTLRDIFEVPGM